mgnify:CR=1 FL=1
MNLVDLIITVSVLFAIGQGWRLGILRGIFGLAGLGVGAWIALQSAPIALDSFAMSTLWRVTSTMGIVAMSALLGESLGFRVGDGIHRTFMWKPIKILDSILGSAFRVASLLAIIWLLTSVLAPLPNQGVIHQIRTSHIVSAIDEYAPDAADRATATLRSAMRTSGFPVVFADVTPKATQSVAAADPALLLDTRINADYAAVYKVEADSVECGERMSGSGVVYARNRIMTNAHVVAGAENITVWSMADETPLRATPVYIDPKLDIAVLAFDGRSVTPVEFGEDASVGTQGVVPGFTGANPLSPDVARVADVLIARGHDIYGVDRVDREIFVLRAAVAEGDSGAPLLGADGRMLGLVFAADKQTKNIGYALTLPAIGHAAEAGRRLSARVATGACIPIA